MDTFELINLSSNLLIPMMLPLILAYGLVFFNSYRRRERIQRSILATSSIDDALMRFWSARKHMKYPPSESFVFKDDTDLLDGEEWARNTFISSLNSLELIARFVEHGFYDENIIKNSHRTTIVDTFEYLQDFIYSERKRTRNPYLCKNLEFLYRRWKTN